MLLLLMRHAPAIEQTIPFLRDGRFRRADNASGAR
jgi:hypothetical protein